MSEPVDFLLARIAEDESRIHYHRELVAEDSGQPVFAPVADRVLAECEAKRKIVELSWHHLGEDDYGWGMEEAKRQILCILALPYADHPDYDESWRP